MTFEPPEAHKAADRVGKLLGHAAGNIGEALGIGAEPVVVNRKGRHVSIEDLERLLDTALEENERE